MMVFAHSLLFLIQVAKILNVIFVPVCVAVSENQATVTDFL